MSDENNRNYSVGYGKPPAASRFKPGQSGNPKGKPKGSRNFSTDLEAELKTRVPITENGKRKKITKQKAVAKQIVNKAVGGDARAIPVLLNEMRQREGSADTNSLTADVIQEADLLVMQNIKERFRRSVTEEITQQKQETETINEKEAGNGSNINKN